MSHSSDSPEDVTDDEPRPELPFAKTRAAFLLGCYLQLPATDLAPPLLLEVCDGLSPTRALLLNESLIRLEEIDVASADRETTSRPATQRFLQRRAVERVRQQSERLWGGHSELRDWYRAGLAVGRLLRAVLEPPASPAPQHILPETSSTWPPSATPPDADEIELLTDAACQACRQAAAWSRLPQNPESLLQFCLHLPANFARLQATGARTSDTEEQEAGVHRDPESHLIRLLESSAVPLRDPHQPPPSAEEQQRSERDQFLYEAIAIWELTGAALIRVCISRAEQRQWPPVARPDKYQELAEEFARRNALPALSSRPRGRPRAVD